jgi:hypothetical protein
MRSFVLVLILLIITGVSAQTQNLTVSERDEYVLTHSIIPAGPVPTAFDPDGVYPYVSYSETSHRPQPHKYHFITLENDLIKVVVCPDLGGKLTSMVHKASGKEVLYVPEVIRQTRILPRFYFVAGGIEVSFPISHSPSQNEKVLYKVDVTDARTYVTCGERELRFGMQWSVEYSLGARDSFLTQRVILFNPGTIAYPWMSWSNAATPAAADTRFYFPEGKVLSHASVVDTIDWKAEGPVGESDIKEMTGYFWITSNVNAFGVFTPSYGSGLFHIADKDIAPGMKLWSYGNGSDSSWSTLSTAKHQRYVEIQGGPIANQSIKLEIEPEETRTHTEFWFPASRPVDIYKFQTPDVNLRRATEIPLFGWARGGATDIWIRLQNSYNKKQGVPEPPSYTENKWTPSGMEKMDDCFNWAIKNSSGQNSALWEFYYGAWLAGRGDTSKAATMLEKSDLSIAKALLARLLRLKGNSAGAVEVYNSISERWLQLHPQVVVERDKALRNLGAGTLKTREQWLDLVAALNDEWVIERRVQLLIDQGRASEAKNLLLSTDFQKVHQTYNRTKMWFRICDLLDESRLPIPEQLGEDRLAVFGAYREYE